MSDAAAIPKSPAAEVVTKIVNFARVSPGIVAGVAVLLFLLLASFLAPLPYDPVTPDPTSVLQPPSAQHIFGTDANGFDVFSRVVAAGRSDLPLALAGTLASLVIGLLVGLPLSVKSKWSEGFMRALDAFQSFPLIVLSVTIVSLTGNDIQNILYAIVIINGPRFIRLIRSEALAIREARFIEAAIATGARPRRVMFRHIMPNVIDVCLVQCSLTTANAVIVIAALNFLGIGVSPPTPTWGSMVQVGAQAISTGQWWIAIWPGVAIFIAIASLNMLANGIQRRVEGS
ncbi:peptide/nickel transport system permease protein [Pseudonocardia thermophila]|jgi:ABC-type dipeptide/oligopeptide/nickel transport systems, permease components|uniref:Peptide/nickel transport system permease protein n=1 Tax=Pseudonocardia thermophila TaxID=1848 RepID=A0A1M6ZWW0_PSETH|nr:ABC transporter permease [Pseudonocardia thermophila]SHL34987.1 peptide/nickel transport system permease protein [Pseudonocardia thermophila]